ncbi:mechanosensitive ion channel family protein [Colwellia sp. M166]|uniref:mechanosensitive ion channel family protein n=1 Tax=Colwellia sp. M166 TaxID=2583805 RepID=UPI00211E7616|nr:mechanosensitive ion channel family protein [Colwellia sp. M166]UUO23648.1 mechanosensitive ion channel family protein [Colwellia sp. M166]|tara:strand:+ start:57514 stop:58779 length:1266 start_codon:yes stop_codon:yes gene_type:complete
MQEIIAFWLTEQGLPTAYSSLGVSIIGLVLILLFCSISFYIAKNYVLLFIHKLTIASKNTWDDLLFDHQVFSRISLLVPLVLLLLLTPLLVNTDSLLATVLIVFAKIGLCFQIARSISSVLNVINSLYRQTASERYLPLNSTLQVIKLVVYLVASILAVSLVLDRSPLYLLSGLGALTAVLILVFQDTIKGLVASIQISANKMVAPGDWIELPKYGADGDVIEIGLNTVKVKNFDNTVTTVPTYALTSGSFKNWRGMLNSGGRRIKRAIVIDVRSIKFYSQEQLEALKSVQLISNYLAEKQAEIKKETAQAISKAPLTAATINTRQLTNIGTFRAYISAYLKQHRNVHHEMTCMVRQLPATEVGLPLELYFFSNDQSWVNYEAIQADIFDHLYAAAPLFDLRVFQHPSGHDWHSSKVSADA